MRQFNQAQKTAVELVTGGTGEADHIVPYSAGGETSVENCQLIPREANRKKSAFVFEPRQWQERFLRSWGSRKPLKPFMLIAIPGSGKTFAALEAARRWMHAGADRRLIVVVPTDNLRNQWQMEAARFGIQLQTREFGTSFKDGYRGGVVTYQLVSKQPMVFRKLCAVSPTMVIFDEIHHCGDESHFGFGVKSGFELAKEKLCMSGTPWKSDGNPIPFVEYDGGGFAVGDYRYDLPDALIDGVVRYLVFDHAKGGVTDDLTGFYTEVNGTIPDDTAAQMLRPLLDPDGEYVRKQISQSHRKLMECRKSIPDAAALAICMDQTHAKKIAEVIKSETGCRPSIIVSDADIENDSVDGFRKSTKEWIVAVRKVSEGTDIKRLQVLCYLTNVVSELFFRQVVGRVSRVRGMEDYEGYVYLPADPRLIAAAKNIQNSQVIAIKEEAERQKKEADENDARLFPEFPSYTTEHLGTDTAMIGSHRVSVQEYKEIERISEATSVPMLKVREIRAMMSNEVYPVIADRDPIVKETKEKRMRSRCNKLAYRVAQVQGVDVWDVHTKFPPQDKMSLEELMAKEQQLNEWIRKG